LMGKSNKYMELCIIKEYLIRETDALYREINKESENAEKKGIPGHLINIFVKKLEERRAHLSHLLDEVLDKIKNLDNELREG